MNKYKLEDVQAIAIHYHKLMLKGVLVSLLEEDIDDRLKLKQMLDDMVKDFMFNNKNNI